MLQMIANIRSGMPPDIPNSMKEELSNTAVLTNKKHKSRVYVVGVNHIDPKSSEDIKTVIRFVKPSAVLLELCDQRQHMAEVNKTEILGELSVDYVLSNWRILIQPDFWLLHLQSMKFESLLGTVNGGEQAIAASEAKSHGANVMFIDLPYSHTIQKCLIAAWYDVGPFKIMKEAVFGDLIQQVSPSLKELNRTLSEFQTLSEEDISDENIIKMKSMVASYFNKDIVKDVVENSDLFKGLQEPLLHDRNTILAYNMQEASRAFKKCVSIVGAAHMDGILSKFGTVTKQDYINASKVQNDKLLYMAAQIFMLSQITPTAVIVASWRIKKIGGNPYRYFKYARRAWIGSGLAWCGYGMYWMRSKYNSTRSFQLRMLDYQKNR